MYFKTWTKFIWPLVHVSKKWLSNIVDPDTLPRGAGSTLFPQAVGIYIYIYIYIIIIIIITLFCFSISAPNIDSDSK